VRFVLCDSCDDFVTISWESESGNHEISASEA